jgi:hypothetical protein
VVKFNIFLTDCTPNINVAKLQAESKKQTMRKLIRSIFYVLTSCLMAACHHKADTPINNAEVLHQNEDKLTQMIIYDVFTPPVASRIYAYASLASYEAMRYEALISPLLPKKEKNTILH